MKKEVKIYCLYNPQTLKIRYIGRTVLSLQKRLSTHICRAKKEKFLYPNRNGSYKNNWICSLLKEGIKPKIRLLTIIEGWEESHKFEKELIQKHLLKHNLVNGDDRGAGKLAKNINITTEINRIKQLKEYYSKEENKNNFYNKMYAYTKDGFLYKEFKSVKFAAEELGVKSTIITNVMSRFDNYKQEVNPQKGYYFSKFLYERHPLYKKTSYQSNYKPITTKDLLTGEIKTFQSTEDFRKFYSLNSWDIDNYRKNIFTKNFKNLLTKIEMPI